MYIYGVCMYVYVCMYVHLFSINRRVEHEEDEVKKVARTRRRSARTVILEARERKRQEKLLKVIIQSLHT